MRPAELLRLVDDLSNQDRLELHRHHLCELRAEIERHMGSLAETDLDQTDPEARLEASPQVDLLRRFEAELLALRGELEREERAA